MIRVENLRKTYRLGFSRKPVEALRGVSIQVNEGDLYGFIGPNGAGKSTTIKILLGLLSPGSGQALLMGEPAGSPASREKVGFLPEQPYFYDYLTGQEFLLFYGPLSPLSGKSLKLRIDEVAETVGIKPDWLRRKLRTYSKGMLQRMGLAQAMLSHPRLLILDEPMSGLDPLGRRDVRNLLQNLHAQGITIFYSSHVLGDVEAICTRLAMVINGEIRRQGTVEEVLAGEERVFQITLADLVPAGDLPSGSVQGVSGNSVLCNTAEAKTQFLHWALNRGLEVESLEPRRNSLEDILAVEVAKDL